MTGVSHVGRCAWCGTIAEFLERFDRGSFVALLKERNAWVSSFPVGKPQVDAWRDEFVKLRYSELEKLPEAFRRLHVAFEYVLPGHEDRETGEVTHEKRPDVVIFSSDQVLVLEFKQREAPPYDGFAKATRGYLRLFEKWHRRVPEASAKGLLVLTKAHEFKKGYDRVKAVSPDRIHVYVKKAFEGHLTPCDDPEAWLSDLMEVPLEKRGLKT